MGGGGVQRILKFLKYLPDQKFRITVITVKPSYYYAYDPELLAEVPKHVTIIRTGSLDPFRLMYLFWHPLHIRKQKPHFTKESGRRIRQIASKFFCPDSRILWYPFALRKLKQLHQQQPIDVLIASVPPFTTAVVATAFRKEFAGKIILDFRDSWRENPGFPHRPSWLEKCALRQEEAALKNADGVIFINPYLEKFYRQQLNDILPRHVTTIRNGYDPADFKNIPQISSKRSIEHPLSIGIIGTIYSLSLIHI